MLNKIVNEYGTNAICHEEHVLRNTDDDCILYPENSLLQRHI